MSNNINSLARKAWTQVLEDEHHDLHPLMRLYLYEYILGDAIQVKVNLLSSRLIGISKTELRFRRYFVLSLLTAQAVLPIWDTYMRKLHSKNQDFEPIQKLPYTIIHISKMKVQGKTDEQIERYITENDYVAGSLGTIPIVIGNLSEELEYSQQMVLETVGSVLGASFGTPPFLLRQSTSLNEHTRDKDLFPIEEINDFAYYACEAVMNCDLYFESGELSQIITNNTGILRKVAFWQWWLLRLIPHISFMSEHDIRLYIDEMGIDRKATASD